MPFKDYEKKLAYQRRYYHEAPGQREKQIARVAKRKWEVYGGVCVNCGEPTMGETKGKAPDYCSKPECASVQRIFWRKAEVEKRKEKK